MLYFDIVESLTWIKEYCTSLRACSTTWGWINSSQQAQNIWLHRRSIFVNLSSPSRAIWRPPPPTFDNRNGGCQGGASMEVAPSGDFLGHMEMPSARPHYLAHCHSYIQASCGIAISTKLPDDKWRLADATTCMTRRSFLCWTEKVQPMMTRLHHLMPSWRINCINFLWIRSIIVGHLVTSGQFLFNRKGKVIRNYDQDRGWRTHNDEVDHKPFVCSPVATTALSHWLGGCPAGGTVMCSNACFGT